MLLLSLPDQPDPSKLSEMVVLGAMVLDDADHDGKGRLLTKYGPIIEPEWFRDERHRAILTAIRRIRESGGVCNAISLVAELDAIGAKIPPGYTLDVCSSSGSPVQELAWHLDRVINDYRLRLLESHAHAAATAIQAGVGDAGEIVEKFQAAVAKVEAIRLADESEVATADAQSLALAFTDRAERWAASGGDGYGWPTGLKILEEFDLRLYGGQRLVIAGEANVGKSTFAAQVALNVARYFRETKSDARVGVLSLEDGRERWVDRAIANLARVPLSSIRKGSLMPMEAAKLAPATAEFANLPLYVETHGDLTIELLPSVFQSLVDRGCRVIVVDYLQEIAAPKASERRDQVGDSCRALKALSLRYNVSVIIVSSLRKLNGSRPTLDDLKESGDIGYIATEVVALRVEEPPEQFGLPTLLGVDVLKQKDGAKGSGTILLCGSIFRLEIPDRHHGPTPTVNATDVARARGRRKK